MMDLDLGTLLSIISLIVTVLLATHITVSSDCLGFRFSAQTMTAAPDDDIDQQLDQISEQLQRLSEDKIEIIAMEPSLQMEADKC
jgi:hypothetical protein